MPFSIWRNSEHLGSIQLAFPGDQGKGIAGIFQPTSAFEDIGEFVQATLDFIGKRVVIQDIPEDIPEHNEDGVELRKLRPEEHVPSDRVLELRDDTGRVIATTLIIFELIDLPPADAEGEFAHACQSLGLKDTAWTVLAGFPKLTPSDGEMDQLDEQI